MAEVKPFTGVDDRVKLSKAVPLGTPFTLNIFPSNVCNFRCNYCAQSLGAGYLMKEYSFPMELMKLEVLERALEQMVRFERRFKLVSFMGHGEPLCNRELPKMIKMVKDAGVANRIDIISNASLLDHRYAEELIEAGLDVLRVSIQGVNAETYKTVCNANINYDEFVDNLRYFSQIKGDSKLYVKTVDVALADGEEKIFFDTYSDFADRIFVDKIKPVYHGVDYSETEKDLSTDRYGNKHEEKLVCPQPFYMMSLWANGDVTPCDALYKASPLGNVMSGDLLEFWNSDKHIAFCKAHLRKEKNSIKSCRNCCAPNDVTNEADWLDEDAEELLRTVYK